MFSIPAALPMSLHYGELAIHGSRLRRALHTNLHAPWTASLGQAVPAEGGVCRQSLGTCLACKQKSGGGGGPTQMELQLPVSAPQKGARENDPLREFVRDATSTVVQLACACWLNTYKPRNLTPDFPQKCHF